LLECHALLLFAFSCLFIAAVAILDVSHAQLVAFDEDLQRSGSLGLCHFAPIMNA
jgi:hypothetical protein